VRLHAQATCITGLQSYAKLWGGAKKVEKIGANVSLNIQHQIV